MYRSFIALPQLSFFFLLCILSNFSTVSATETAGKEQAAQIKELYKSIYQLHFDFRQQTTTGSRVREGVGKGSFLRPAASEQIVMRWDYMHPARQIIVNTGQKLSIYTEEDKQLIIAPVDQSTSDITLALFSGTTDIMDTFTVSVPEADSQLSAPEHPWQTMLLTPKEPHPQLQQIRIWYSADFLIHKLVLLDHFDSKTTLVLTNIKTDTTAPPNEKQLFQVTHIDIPEDTEIIQQ